MLNFMYDNKGAVSIFLVLVLVPMLMISAVFVDMGRLKLANSVAEASGELTLNTALTNYDAVLKNMYGLFATSQDADDLYDSLEDYYRKSIESAGVAEPDAESYVQQIMQLLKSETGNDDLMNMQLTGFEVEMPTGASLANPAVLKAQLVEFMKYRGPIELGTGIFDALTSFKNMKKQSDLINKKTEFYDKRVSIMEELEAAWRQIESYQYKDAYGFYKTEDMESTFPGGTGLTDRETMLGEAKKALETAMEYYVRYVHYGTGFPTAKNHFLNFYVTQDTSPSDQKINGTNVKAGDTYFKHHMGDASSATVYVMSAEPESNTDLESLKNYFKLAFNSIQNLEHENKMMKELEGGNSDTSTAKIKMVAIAADTLGKDYYNYHTEIKSFLTNVTALYNHYEGYKKGIKELTLNNPVEAAELPSLSDVYVVKKVEQNGATKIDKFITASEKDSYTNTARLTDMIDTGVLIHLHANHTTTQGYSYLEYYSEIMKRMAGFWSETQPIYTEAIKKMESNFELARTHADFFKSFLESKISKLNEAVNKLNGIKATLDDPNSEYNKAMAAWKNSSNQLPGDNMAETDKKEIEKINSAVTSEDISKLITRINNAKASLEVIQGQLDSYTVLGTKWYDIKENSNYKVTMTQIRPMFTDTHKKWIEDTKLLKSYDYQTIEYFDSSDKLTSVTATYDKGYDTAIKKLKNLIVTVDIKTTWDSSENSTSPDLQNGSTSLYTWLYNNFFDKQKVEELYKQTYDITKQSHSTLSDSGTTKISDNKDNADSKQTDMESKADELKGKEDKVQMITKPSRTYVESLLPSGDVDYLSLLKNIGADGKRDADANAMMKETTGALGFFDGLAEAAVGMATGLRDDMYVVSYIMNMFSHAAYENEISVKYTGDSQVFGSWYEIKEEQKDGETKKSYVYTQKFKNEDSFEKMVKEARTLTNVSIDPNNNFLYGEEIEYIIYGKDGGTKSFAMLFLIRFALNTIYAFTDSEITNLAQAMATAIFGTPPLTPLIPIAKIAIVLGVAIAETTYDLWKLKEGNKIPLIKSKETWVMKPSSALKEVGKEILYEAAETAIDTGMEMLNKALEMTNDELQALINSGELELSKISEAAIENATSEIKNYANQAIQEVVNLCNDIRAETFDAVRGQTQEKIELISKGLDDWLEQSKQNDGADSPIYTAKKAAVDYLKANGGAKIGKLIDAIETSTGVPEEIAEKIKGTMDDMTDEINSKIDDLIEQGGNALSGLVDDLTGKLGEAAKEGAAKLKETLKGKIGNMFGCGSEGDEKLDIKGENGKKSAANVMASLLEWSYSDYLQIILMVGMITSPETILLRTSDLIQLNMQQVREQAGYIETTEEVEVSRLFGLINYTKSEIVRSENPEAFSMKNAYTYLKVRAYIDVRPLLMTLPFMAETTENGLTGNQWYQIKYEGTLGY